MTGGTGRVTGTFTNSNQAPLAGTIVFSPSVTHLLVNGVTVLPAPVTATLVNGVLHDAANNPYVDLLATDAPDQNPLRFSYKVTPSLTFASRAINYPAFNIEVPGGLVTDLVDVARVPGNLSQGVSVGRQGPRGPVGTSGVVVLPLGAPAPVNPESGVLYLRLTE